MDCPYCNHPESRVTNKRTSPEGIRRRRECLKCKKRFTTSERICQDDFFVVKKDGSRQKFEREKLSKGINKAFEKRPISQEDIDSMITDIESSLRKKGQKEIKSTIIGELVMKKIKKMDNVAYIRFASVYRDFKDLKDFKEELKEMN